MSRSVSLTFSGDSPAELAGALARAAELSRGESDADVSEPRHRRRLRVIVSEPRGPRSFADAVAYARGEVGEGIALAGGAIHDGTHVEIQWLNGPFAPPNPQ